MPARKRVWQSQPKEAMPGALYKEIPVPKEVFAGAEAGLEKKKLPAFVAFCKRAYKTFPTKKSKFSPKHQDAVDFLEWDLKPEELSSAQMLSLVLVIAFGGIAAALAFIFYGSELSSMLNVDTALLGFYLFFPVIAAALLAAYLVQNKPIAEARAEQVRALTYVPEILGYMIMSMKLVPNLEKAVEFAAEHGKGKIAEDFKQMIWDVQIGVKLTLSEALDDLAYRWGKFSSEFKQSLMMVRASVLEDTEAKRHSLLDKTMTDVLESIKDKMEKFARELSQPAIALFYIGVLLPLILIIILPVGSAFSGQAMAKPEVLIVLYNIILPLVAFYFATNIISKRPPTYEVPEISASHPLLPKKWKIVTGKRAIDLRFVIAIVFIVGTAGSYYMHLNGIPIAPATPTTDGTYILQPDKTMESVLAKSPNMSQDYFEPDGALYRQLVAARTNPEDARAQVEFEKQKFLLKPENDVAPYNLLFGLVITISVGIFFYLHYSNIYKRKIQEQTMQMESEFKDSLYILASRLGENKPVEEALKHTKEFLPTYRVSSEVFGKTIDNITLLGMPLEKAVFDSQYGALKDNPSSIIRSSMKIMIDSVQLGVNVAAKTLISLSLQLSNTEKVNKTLKSLTADVSSMMQLMAMFIAPAILGITTSLHKVVMSALSSVVSYSAVGLGELPSGFGGGFTSMLGETFVKAEAFQGMVMPAQFLLILAAYIIELVIILTFFTTKIQEDNNLLVKLNIARSLPIATLVFFASSIFANTIVGGFLVS